jgi:hypothetical protein
MTGGGSWKAEQPLNQNNGSNASAEFFMLASNVNDRAVLASQVNR